MHRHGPPADSPLAARLDHLFRTVTRPSGGEFSYREVAAAVQNEQGITISASYIWALRTSKKANPTMQHIVGLAKFFGVPAAYFFDHAVESQVNRDLETLQQLQALRASLDEAGVLQMALRARTLSPSSLEAIRSMVERLSALEHSQTGVIVDQSPT